MPTTDTTKVGQVAVAATNTAQQIPKTGGSSTGGVVIKALSANVGKLYIGTDSTVTNLTGFELAAGEALSLEVLNLGKLWIYGTISDRLSWALVNA